MYSPPGEQQAGDADAPPHPACLSLVAIPRWLSAQDFDICLYLGWFQALGCPSRHVPLHATVAHSLRWSRPVLGRRCERVHKPVVPVRPSDCFWFDSTAGLTVTNLIHTFPWKRLDFSTTTHRPGSISHNHLTTLVHFSPTK